MKCRWTDKCTQHCTHKKYACTIYTCVCP